MGLDLGTNAIKMVVSKIHPDLGQVQIINISQVPSFGIRRGVIVNSEEALRNLKEVIRQSQQQSGYKIERVYLGLGGNHINCRTSRGVVAVSRADGEISQEDVTRVINAAKAVVIPQNREIVHILPRSFTIDGQNNIKDPVGMSGIRLEVDALIIEGATPFIKNLTKCIEMAGLEIEEMILNNLAVSRFALSQRQKELGSMVLDIGGGTSDLTVFEEGDIIHSDVLPIGSSHISNDLAIGLRTTVDIAERIKSDYGAALSERVSKKDSVDLSEFGEEGEVPRSYIAEIIEARLSEILDLVNKELKKVDRESLLPGGVVLCGGGAKIPGIVELAKHKLRLPVQMIDSQELTGSIEKASDPSFACVLGLILWGSDQAKTLSLRPGFRGFKIPALNKFKKWLRGFIP